MSWLRRFVPVMGLLAIATALIPNKPAIDQLHPFQTLTRQISRGKSHSYWIRLKENDCVRVAVDQMGVDIRIAVRGFRRVQPLELNTSPWGREELTLIADHPGTYHVEISPGIRDAQRGTYQLVVSSIRSASDADRVADQAQRILSAALPALTAPNDRLFTSLQEAAELWRTSRNAWGEAHALKALGKAYDRTGAYQQADEAYRRALALFVASRDDVTRMDTQMGWVNLGGHLGELRGGTIFLHQQLAAWRKLGDARGEARVLSSIATEYLLSKNYSEGIWYTQRALQLRRALGNEVDLTNSLTKLSSIYVALHQYNEAKRYTFESIALSAFLGDKRGQAASQAALCQIYLDSNYIQPARDCYQELRLLHQQVGDTSAELIAVHRLSQCEYRLGQYTSALRSIDEALSLEGKMRRDIGNPLWRVSLASRTENYYWKLRYLVSAHSRNPGHGYDQQAFELMDRRRALFMDPKRLPTLSELKSALSSDDLLLVFYIDHLGAFDSGLVWALQRDKVSMHAIPNPRSVRAKARELYGYLTAQSSFARGEPHQARVDRLSKARVAAAGTAKEFSRMVLGPVAHKLRHKRLLVVSDESFASVPFGLLPDPEEPDKLLIENHEIVQIPSLTAILEMRRRAFGRPKPERLLALISQPAFDNSYHVSSNVQAVVRASGITPDGHTIPPLPFATKEASAIASMVSREQMTRLEGFDATREAFMRRPILEDHQILHLTTHAVMNLEQPELSGLILALADHKGHPVDGVLSLKDILNLRIRADLVTLGACQTALGKEVAAHGVVSLAAAFLRAGASQAISTTWKVDDEATAELMTQFYKALLVEHLSTAAALQKAQLALMRSQRWQSPYYWGGFTLWGDWRPILFGKAGGALAHSAAQPLEGALITPMRQRRM